MNEEDYVSTFKPHMMDVVNAWCNGATFSQICKMTNIFEGKISCFFLLCRISYIQGGKFSLSNKKSTNLCGCKSYLFHVNNYMSSTNVLSVSGDRYMDKRYPKWILSPYHPNDSSVCVREDVGQCKFNFVLFLGYALCTSTLL